MTSTIYREAKEKNPNRTAAVISNAFYAEWKKGYAILRMAGGAGKQREGEYANYSRMQTWSKWLKSVIVCIFQEADI